jgi:hypothetical protein
MPRRLLVLLTKPLRYLFVTRWRCSVAVDDESVPGDEDTPEPEPDATTGSKFAKRNAVAANDFTIARSIWNMHDALLNEQRRTNQLLEWIGGILQTRPDHKPETGS